MTVKVEPSPRRLATVMRPPHSRDQPLGDPKANPEAAISMLGDDLLESAENARLLVGRHADAPIVYVQLREAVIRAESKRHGFANAEFARV